MVMHNITKKDLVLAEKYFNGVMLQFGTSHDSTSIEKQYSAHCRVSKRDKESDAARVAMCHAGIGFEGYIGVKQLTF